MSLEGVEISLDHIPVKSAQNHALGSEVPISDTAWLNQKAIVDPAGNVPSRGNNKTRFEKIAVEIGKLNALQGIGLIRHLPTPLGVEP